MSKPWPHAPFHLFNVAGTYMITASTMNKAMFFKENNELDLLHDLLLEVAEHYQWRLEAWAVFANHYHFVAHSPQNSSSLKKLITHLHASSAKELNKLHQTTGRKVWYQYWDTRITFHKSYLARLHYVMHNPVKHHMVDQANQYKWCSVNWFEQHATKAYREVVMSLNTDHLNVIDEF